MVWRPGLSKRQVNECFPASVRVDEAQPWEDLDLVIPSKSMDIYHAATFVDVGDGRTSFSGRIGGCRGGGLLRWSLTSMGK